MSEENKYGKSTLAIIALSLDGMLALRTDLSELERDITCRRFMVDYGRVHSGALKADWAVGKPNKDNLANLKLNLSGKETVGFALTLARMCQEIAKVESLAGQVGYHIRFDIPQRVKEVLDDQVKNYLKSKDKAPASEQTPKPQPQAVAK